MSDILLHAQANVRLLPGAQSPQRSVSPAVRRSWRDIIRMWMQRARQRQALAHLAELGPHLLRDIGVSYEEARREAEKPFWR